jgi:protein ImuA
MFLICSHRTAGETMQTAPPRAILEALRAKLARLEHGHAPSSGRPVLPFGIPAIDQTLPGGGLAAGALHEIAGAGAQAEHGTTAALLAAGLLARVPGMVLWVLERRDLFAPALAAVGLTPERVIYVEAGKPTTVLLVMEEGLRHRGLAGVVGELGGRLTLTASRRLQLAAEQSGVTSIALRRSRRFDDPALAEPNAATSRWRVAALPSPPPLPQAPQTPGLGRQRWRLDLTRCRGGEPQSWIVEAFDATGRLALVADLANRPAAPGANRPAAPGANRPAVPGAGRAVA